MADLSNTTSTDAEISGPEPGGSLGGSKIWSIPGEFFAGGQRVEVRQIRINNQIFTPIHGIPVKAGDNLEFRGTGLSVFSRVGFALESEGSSLKTVLKASGSTDSVIFFNIPNLSGSVKDGGFVWLKLLSARQIFSKTIAPYLEYLGKPEEESEEEKKAKAVNQEEEEIKKSSAGQSDQVSQIINSAIGGAPEAFGAGIGMTTKPGAAAAANTSKGINTGRSQATSDAGGGEDLDNDASDIEESSGAVESQEVGGSSILESSVGTQTVSQGATIKQSSVGSQTVSASQTGLGNSISTGGTVEANIKSTQNISSGGTVTSSGSVQTSGTTEGNLKTSAGGTVSGSLAQNVSINAAVKENAPTAGQSQAKGQEQTQSQNESVQSNASEEVSGNAEGKIERTVQESVQQASQGINAGNKEAEAGVEEKTQGNLSGQIKSENKSSASKPEQKPDAKNNVQVTDESEEKIASQTSEQNESKPKPAQAKPEAGQEKETLEKKEPQAQEKEEKPQKAVKKPSPASGTAGLGQSFSAAGGTGGINPAPLGVADTLNRFKAGQEALKQKLGGVVGKPGAINPLTGRSEKPLDAAGGRNLNEDSEENKTKSNNRESGKEEISDKDNANESGPIEPGKEVSKKDEEKIPDSGGLPQQPGQEVEKQENNEEEESDTEEKNPSDGGVPGQQPGQTVSKQDLNAQLKEAETLANKAANTFLQRLANMVWGAAFPTFGLSLLAGAILGDFIWLAKNWVVKKALSALPLPKKLSHIDTKELQINFSLGIKLQILIWNIIVACLMALTLIFIISVLWGICNSWVTAYPAKALGLDPVCKMINQSSLGQGLSSLRSSGTYTASYNTSGDLISTAKWTDAINTAAQSWNMDACVLRVVVQKESGGQENVIGCDCAANGKPQLCTDRSKNYYSGYQFNWAQCSYGIGLTQWTIYQSTYANASVSDTANYFKRWQNASTPSRTPFGDQFYTVADFLNPQTSLGLTARNFSNLLSKNGGDVAAAFRSYAGPGAPQSWIDDRMALYSLCKNTDQSIGGGSGGGGASDTWPPPVNNEAVNLNTLVKPWSGSDPYPKADWGSLDPNIDLQIKARLDELKLSFNALNSSWMSLGRGGLQIRQAYRPQAYTDHYRSIWEINAILKGQDNTVGYRCNEVSHLDPVKVKKLTTEQIQSLQTEFARHEVNGPTPAGCISDHSSGTALDIDSPDGSLYSGSLYSSLMKEANKFGLCHNISGDQPHYSLTKYLATGSNCFQP